MKDLVFWFRECRVSTMSLDEKVFRRYIRQQDEQGAMQHRVERE